MMRKMLVFMLAVLACSLFACAFADEINETFAAYDEIGKVIAVEVNGDAATIEAEGYFGFHMDQDPSMTVKVTIDSTCTILSAEVTAAKDQTPGFDAAITQDYMNAAYVGALADPNMEADAVSGATVTSKAVRYAVQTAAYYAQNALGYAADTDAESKRELSNVYPATYKTIETTFKPDKKIGSILYAAEGIASDGTEVVAVKVKSSNKVTQTGSAKTGWDSSVPNAFTMIIVIDKATSTVCASEIVVDGTRSPAYFAVPAEKVEAYRTVVIADATAFDDFMDGLVLEITADYTTQSSDDGPVITGTSIVYTGATTMGTFSSQLIRNCFRAAAGLYCAL